MRKGKTPEKLKVCRIATRLNIGGPARQVQELSKMPVDYLVLCGMPDDREGNMGIPAVNHAYVPLQREIHFLDDLTALFCIIWRLIKFKPDIVHTHTSKAGFLGRIAAWIARVPVRIHTFHGHTLYGYWGFLKTWCFRILEHLLGYITTRIIAISPSQKEEIASYIGHRKKIVVIRDGYDLSKFDNNISQKEARKRLGWPKDRQIFGFVGRLVPVKNVDGFIQFCAKYYKYYRYWFVVVGDGPDREKIPDWIHWEPWRDDIELVYKAINALVLTSRNEGVPATIVEAKLSGCPVLWRPPVGGVNDVLDLSNIETLQLHSADGLRSETMKLYRECMA